MLSGISDAEPLPEPLPLETSAPETTSGKACGAGVAGTMDVVGASVLPEVVEAGAGVVVCVAATAMQVTAPAVEYVPPSQLVQGAVPTALLNLPVTLCCYTAVCQLVC